ncbi:MAG TPA: hypothetical protein VJT73_12240 [Polyangiaceae bacterium]|nr:hypothetical protein [Polyangiaceae bacterium]
MTPGRRREVSSGNRSLARTELPRPLREFWNDPSWQKIWLAIQSREWRSLAIVPASPGVPTLEVAQALVDVGWQHRGLPIGLADLRNVTLPYIDSVIDEVRAHVYGGERILIALRSVFENPATVPIAQAADSSLLCVGLGRTKISSAEESIEQIGSPRFLGSIVVHAKATGRR